MPSFLSSRQRQALHLAWRFIRPYRKQALAALLEHDIALMGKLVRQAKVQPD